MGPGSCEEYSRRGAWRFFAGVSKSGSGCADLTYAQKMRPKTVRVRLISFGPWRDRLPRGGQWRELPEGAAVAALAEALRSEGVFDGAALQSAAFAVNQEYARPSQTLMDGDEVAILPPVSGGSPVPLVAIVQEPIDTAALLAEIKAGEDGAVCVFDGVVRNNTRGRPTLHLDYEAYEEMALKQMRELRAEAVARFGVREVALVHRLGRLQVGETSVLIAVASAHRGAAFEACRWVIDTLKKTVPIWKHEQFADGAVWSDGEPFPEGLTGQAS